MGNGGPENRKSKRINASFTVSCKLDKMMETHLWIGDREVEALIMDLSDLGMAIVTRANIPVGTILSINFTLINFKASSDKRTRPMQVTGEIRSSAADGHEHRLGICFTHIGSEDKEAIREFVADMA